MNMKKIGEIKCPLNDLLPKQEHYYFLVKGDILAVMGPSLDKKGILIFPNLERAEAFAMTVAKGKGYEPVKVSFDVALATIMVDGKGNFCVWKNKQIDVCTLPAPLMADQEYMDLAKRILKGYQP
jgi:hypothetical protein